MATIVVEKRAVIKAMAEMCSMGEGINTVTVVIIKGEVQGYWHEIYEPGGDDDMRGGLVTGTVGIVDDVPLAEEVRDMNDFCRFFIGDEGDGNKDYEKDRGTSSDSEATLVIKRDVAISCTLFSYEDALECYNEIESEAARCKAELAEIRLQCDVKEEHIRRLEQELDNSHIKSESAWETLPELTAEE